MAKGSFSVFVKPASMGEENFNAVAAAIILSKYGCAEWARELFEKDSKRIVFW